MGEKIRGFMSCEGIQKIKNGQADHTAFCAIKPISAGYKYIEVEIAIIEPVYEYKILLKKQDSDEIVLSTYYYTNTNEYLLKHGDYFFKPIRIIEETKRVRK